MTELCTMRFEMHVEPQVMNNLAIDGLRFLYLRAMSAFGVPRFRILHSRFWCEPDRPLYDWAHDYTTHGKGNGRVVFCAEAECERRGS